MSLLSGPPQAANTGAAVAGGRAASSVDQIDEVPARAEGVQLLGQMQGSGYRRPPALARRRDGQVLQLTPVLYCLLSEIDGSSSYAEVAARVSDRLDRHLDAAGARSLVDGQLRPLGLLKRADGSEPEVRRANPLLALRFRWVVSDPERTRRLTGPFARLFHPVIVLAVVLAFGWICEWLLFNRGLGYAAHQAFARPGLLLAIFLITVVSAGFHEFGHAAAARYGGATPGVMGAGLYLVWPAFYTDVTDSYRLGRGGRLRTDLGGLYFNALLSVAVFGLWWVTGWDALLLVVATQLLQMIRQLPPMLRFDGYHILADATGVPDLFHHIGPTVRGVLPWRRSESPPLKWWARAIVTIWVLLVVPLMILTAVVTVVAMPRILATAAASLRAHWDEAAHAFGAGHILGGLAGALAVLAVLVPVAGAIYMILRLIRRLVASTLRATDGKPVRRSLAGLVAAALVVALAMAWWPRGNYRQIQSYERGALQDALAASTTTLQRHSDFAVWPGDAFALPTAAHPALALVLVPRSGTGPTWVFPFDRPQPPGPGDNQTLAVATRNGSSAYDVAFALVWATGDTVLNKNEAYAFASCSHCKAEAISFQIVLIVGHANVIAPQNLSAAVNYNCIVCLTQALAVQLVLTLPGRPSAAEIRDINALWRQIQAWSKNIRNLPFAVIHAKLLDYEQQMIAIITKDSGGVAPSVVAPSGSQSPTGSAAPASDAGGAAGSSAVSSDSAPASSAAPTATETSGSAPPSPAAPTASGGAPPS